MAGQVKPWFPCRLLRGCSQDGMGSAQGPVVGSRQNGSVYSRGCRLSGLQGLELGQLAECSREGASEAVATQISAVVGFRLSWCAGSRA